MDYQEQVTGVERLPDGRVPEYIVRDPATDHPVAFDGHLDASGSTPEKFEDAKDGYRSLVSDPGTPWARGMKATLLDEAEQDVLGADVIVVEHPGLFLGQHDDPAGAVGEAFEHGYSFIDLCQRC